MRYNSLFLNSLLLFLVTQVFFHYSGFVFIKNFLYVQEVTLIFISLLFVSLKGKRGFVAYGLTYFLFLLMILLINVLVSHEMEATHMFKIIGGVVIFIAAYNLNSGEDTPNTMNMAKAIIISILPFFVFFIDIIFSYKVSSNSMSIFSNSNNFIFYSICSFWLISIYHISRKYAVLYLFFGFLITSTLGALLSILISAAFYFRNKLLRPSSLIVLLFLTCSLLYLLMFSEIYLFQKIRGSFEVFSALYSKYDLTELSQVKFGEAMKYSSSKDGGNVSFLFRVKMWTECFVYFINQDLSNILFGSGFGTIPKNNSFGLVAHNDYLTWLVEFGVVGFFTLSLALWSGFKTLKNNFFIIPYLSVLVYFFTENLYFNFFGVAIFSYSLAVSIRLIKNESIVNK